jgi:hypothetical protein
MSRGPSKRLTWVVDRWVNIDLYHSKITQDPITGCLNYSHPLNNAGYGMVGYRREIRSTPGTRNGNMMTAHRLAFLIDRGWLPSHPQEVHHICHNRVCCNPAHLKTGTHTQKMRELHEAGLAFHLQPGQGGRPPGSTKYSVTDIHWGRRATVSEVQARWNLTLAQAIRRRTMFRNNYPWLPYEPGTPLPRSRRTK